MITLNHAYDTEQQSDDDLPVEGQFLLPLMYTLNARKTSVYQSLAARFIQQ